VGIAARAVTATPARTIRALRVRDFRPGLVLAAADDQQGAAVLFVVSTAAGDDFLKFAAEVSNRGLPGPGIAYWTDL
jgi:hypothetical protein